MSETMLIAETKPTEPMEEAVPPLVRGWTWLDALLLFAVLALAAAVRYYFIDLDLTYDELWHQALSTGRGSPFGYFERDTLYENPPRFTFTTDAPGWWRAWFGGMDGVLHPPLYVVTLRWWRDVFGDGDVPAISYSIVWSLVGIGFTFAALRLAADRWIAFTAALAMSVASSQVYFAQEVRGYAMLIGIAAIALWLMTRIELLGPTRRRAVALGLLPLPLLLTHYFAFGAAVAILIHGLLRLHGRRRSFLVALCGGALFYTVLWLPWAIQQLDDLSTGDAFLKHKFDLPYELALLASAPMRLLVDLLHIEQPRWLAGGVLFVLPFLLIRRARWLLPWALWLTCTIFALVALDAIRSTRLLFLARYFAVASPAVFLLAAGTTWKIHRGLAHALTLTLAFMGGIYLVSRMPVVGECATFADLERDLAKNIQDGDGLLIYHGVLYTFTSDALALQASHSPKLFPRPMMIIKGPMTSERVTKLPRRTWLVTGNLEMPIEVLVPGAKVIKRVNPDINVSLFYLELPRVAATAHAPRP